MVQCECKMIGKFSKIYFIILISSRALDTILSQTYFSLVINMYVLQNTDPFCQSIIPSQMGRVFLMSPHIDFSL